MSRCLTLILLCVFCAVAAEPTVDWEKVKSESLQHFQSIVRINTTNPPGNEVQITDYLGRLFDREGIPYKVFTLEPGRANLVARLKGNGRKRPILVLGHTDTVGIQREKWPVDPFGAVLREGFVWGRGTTDNKDMVTAGLMLMLQLKRLQVPLDRDVIYVAEAGEESTARVGIEFLVASIGMRSKLNTRLPREDLSTRKTGRSDIWRLRRPRKFRAAPNSLRRGRPAMAHARAWTTPSDIWRPP